MPMQTMTMNTLTIDLEDWYHCFERDKTKWSLYENRIEKPTMLILDELEKTNNKATFFVLADVANKNPGLIKTIDRHGHEIACHGSNHKPIYCQTPNEFVKDVSESIEIIQSLINKPIQSYRAPFFSITTKSLWALEILKGLGIKFDSSIFPIRNYRYGIPHANPYPNYIIEGLLELPLSIYRCNSINIPVAGGVYFRILPFVLTDYFINKIDYLNFYIHPWEFDTEQPKIQRYSFQGIRHYWSLKNTYSKFIKLLNKHKFNSIRSVYGSSL
jgi:polysaccharide deacetylase family protein (PEP-CTERM system associated)